MSRDFCAMQGRKDGAADGASGRPRNPRPDEIIALYPELRAAYMAAYDVAYATNFAAREQMLRRAALQDERQRTANAEDRQAEHGRDI